MKVLLVQGTSTGGVGRHVLDVARGVLGAGHAVLIAGPQSARPGVDRAFAEGGDTPRFVAVEIATSPRPLADRRAVSRLRGLAAEADVVHAHGLRAGALAAVAMARSRTPLIVTLHNLPVGGPLVEGVGRGLLRIIARRAEVVLGVSQDLVAAARSAGAGLVGRALVPIPAAAEYDIEDILAARDVLAGGDADVSVVLTVARLAPQKGLDTLIDAAAQLSAGARPLQFVVVGDGPLQDSLQARIEESGAPVVLLGARDDVPLLMRAADLLVIPSRWEGQPLVAQEGLQAGCAMVATDVGGTREVTSDAALLVGSSDPVALREAIASVLTVPGRLDELRDRSRQRATTLPTQADLASQLLGRYSDLVRRRR